MNSANPSTLIRFFVFGLFSLTTEVLWLRLLALVLGSEQLSLFYTTCGFFLGMAAGAGALNSPIAQSAHRARWFGALSLCAGIYIIFSPILFAQMGSLPGNHPTATLFWAFLLMLPGTFCFGGMFTAIICGSNAPAETEQRRVGGLYTAETIGGMLGVAVLLYFVAPKLGLDRAGFLLGGIGCVLGVSSLLSKRAADATRSTASPTRSDVASIGLMVINGIVGLATQVLFVHLLSHVLSNTVYTFGAALAIYLGCLSFGSWLQAYALQRKTLAWWFVAYIVSLAAAGWIIRSLLPKVLGEADPGSLAALTTQESALIFAVFFLPATASGAIFARLLSRFANGRAGQALAINAIGAVLGILAVAWFGITTLGAAYTLGMIALLSFIGLCLTQPTKGSIGLGLAAVALCPYSFDQLVPVPEGRSELLRKESLFGTVLVTEQNKLPLVQLNRYAMGGQLGFGEARLGHLALLSHPAPKRVLVLGMGSGVTAGAALAHHVEQLDVVEIVPELQSALPFFQQANQGLSDDTRVTIHTQDARQYLKHCEVKYDVVIADLFHPARNGAGSLYAVEHFQAIKTCLEPEQGVFVQWLPLYQLAHEHVQSIAHSAGQVFPKLEGMIGLYNHDFSLLGLIANAPDQPNQNNIASRATPEQAAGRYVDGYLDWRSSFWMDQEALKAFSKGAQVNSDLRPHLTFSAHEVLYRDQADISRENLNILLSNAELETAHALQSGADHRVHAYQRAAKRYLQAEQLAKLPDTTPQALIDEYIASYTHSMDFKPVHGRLYLLAAKSPGLADYIFPKMMQAQPDHTRTYQLYLKHLRATGQEQRYTMVLQAYLHRFPGAATPR